MTCVDDKHSTILAEKMCAENVRTRAVVTFTPFWPNWRQAGGRLEAGWRAFTLGFTPFGPNWRQARGRLEAGWRQAGRSSRKDVHLFGQTRGRLEAAGGRSRKDLHLFGQTGGRLEGVHVRICTFLAKLEAGWRQ